MPEDLFVTEQPKQFDIGRILSLMRRRHLQFILPFFLGWLVVWTASWFMPVRYKSTTTILVQQSSLPHSYVTPNTSVTMQDQLSSLTEQILSRTRLLFIANRLHLYQKRGHSPTPDAIVAGMRKDIKIDLVRDPSSAAISGFTVSYLAPSPRLAQQVTSDLTNLFIQNNQTTLQKDSENTTKFLQQQLAKARVTLSENEAKVRQFQLAHQGTLPAQQVGTLQLLSSLQSQLQNNEDSLSTARQQQVYDQSLIEQYNSLHASVQGSSGTAADLAALDAQLTKMKSQLADLETRYTARYPAVQDLQDQINSATKDRNRLLAALQAGSKAQPTKQSNAPSATAVTPSTDAAMLQLRSQLRAVKAEIANRRQTIAALNARIASYQSRLSAEPAVAAQLSALTQSYEQAQNNYNDLLKKVSNSSMATSMEQIQQNERFSLLDPPSLPTAPASPDRVKMSLIGLAAGLALGLLVAGTLEFLDDRLYSDKDIEDLLPVAVIGEIPELAPAEKQRSAKRKLTFTWALTALIFLVILSGSAFNYMNASRPSVHLHTLLSNHHV